MGRLASSFLVLLMASRAIVANGADLSDLPLQGTSERPLILLELGSAPPATTAKEATTKVAIGKLTAHEGDESVRIGNDAVTTLHKGFGTWSSAFRFDLGVQARADSRQFWARWKQGGVPDVCLQTFEIWAGPNAASVEHRATLRLKPKGWRYDWIVGGPLVLKADDAVIEVRDSGAGHDAKVFDAFLLTPTDSTPSQAAEDLTGETVAVATPLHDGVPEAWLVGGLQDGVAGMSIFGLDTETVIRPNLNQPYLSTEMMGGSIRRWQKASTTPNGIAIIESATQHSYGWSRGTGYAQIYLHADMPTQAVLRLRQSGIKTAGWLDGKPLAFSNDPMPPADFPKPGAQPEALLQGLTTEGLVMTALPERGEPAQAVPLNLSPGWHSLLIKLVMQHDKGQSFLFAERFTDAAGRPSDSIKTQLTDPTADLARNALAGRLRPLVYVNAPANLPRPGDPLKLRVDMRWHPVLQEPTLTVPLSGFRAKLRLRLTDYDGNEIAVREVKGQFPSEVAVDFGRAPEPGYYAVYPSLYTAAGKLIMSYPADGFTVVRGAAAQRERLAWKKLWNNYYYALSAGDKGFQQEGGYLAWLERTGIYQSYGSDPGLNPELRAKWDAAKRRGIVLFADTSGDSKWLNDKRADGQKFIETVAPYTRFFKATNEIDIRGGRDWQKLRNPEHWVERAKWEYEAVHKARPDGHYVGGSLVRPGDGGANQGYAGGLGPGTWFTKVLELGLDKYQDAWDVHAYPQFPPRFGGPIGNSGREDDRGVNAAYAKVGRKNTLPFWLGETGARAAHGYTGRRWQAEQTAKMIAWVNSRNDYLGIAFCLGHEYDWGHGRFSDYSMGHKPGEAALYTAGALIDGLPYKLVDTKDVNVQAAYFGETFMIWTPDKPAEWQMRLDPGETWVVVDVVGRSKALRPGANGSANLTVTSSPIYVLTTKAYDQLTRF